MSTTFAIFIDRVKTDGHGYLTDEDMDIPHIKIAFRSNGQIRFKSELEPIIKHLPDSVEVHPIDNDADGIYTIGDIRKEIARGK